MPRLNWTGAGAGEARAKLEAVLEQLPSGVLVIDASKKLVLSNRRVAEIWRRPFVPTGSGVKVDHVDPEALAAGRAEPVSAEDRSATPIVACGKAFASTQAMWRFLGNDRMSRSRLVEPLCSCAREYIEADRAEFLLVTRWESEEAIRRFAGDDPGSV